MKIITAAGLFLFSVAHPLAAADPAAARVLLDQAIRAHGGEAALARATIMSQKLKGTVFQVGGDIALNAELVLHLPDQIRATLQIEANQQKIKTTLVADGDKGWRDVDGNVLEMTKSELQELRDDNYIQWLMTIVPLKDPSIALELLPEIRLDGRPAVGLKASRKGFPDVKLYFDRRNDLLVKIDRKGKFGGLGIDKEYRFEAYQDFDGVKLPTKITESLNGKKFTETQVLSIRFPGRVPDGTFARP